MRWAGKVGFSKLTEISPGVWDDVITERDYMGTVVQESERLVQGDTVLPTYRVSTSISILLDGPLRENHSDIRYVTFNGYEMTVSSVTIVPPRVILYMGEKYNG